MSDESKIVWETLRPGHRWVDYTEEKREHIRNCTVPFKLMSLEEIRAAYGDPIPRAENVR